MTRRYPLLRLMARIGCRFGHAPSMVLLGAIVESSGGEAAIESANRWYRRAADRGDPQAMWSLGVNHLSCKGGTTDNEQAVYWLKRAAERDHELATWALARMYLKGYPLGRDVARGLELLRASAERGHRAACQSLAEIYREGQYGQPIDALAADRWSERAEPPPPRPWLSRMMARLSGSAR